MTLIRNHLLIPILSLLAIACTDLDTIIHESSEKSESYRIPIPCFVSEGCVSKEGITFWLDKSTIIEEEEFSVFLHIETNEHVSLKSAIIEGRTMNMGYIPLFFVKKAPNTYKAKGMIGSCDTENMQWQIRASMLNGDELLTLLIPIPI